MAVMTLIHEFQQIGPDPFGKDGGDDSRSLHANVWRNAIVWVNNDKTSSQPQLNHGNSAVKPSAERLKFGGVSGSLSCRVSQCTHHKISFQGFSRAFLHEIQLKINIR